MPVGNDCKSVYTKRKETGKLFFFLVGAIGVIVSIFFSIIDESFAYSRGFSGYLDSDQAPKVSPSQKSKEGSTLPEMNTSPLRPKPQKQESNSLGSQLAVDPKIIHLNNKRDQIQMVVTQIGSAGETDITHSSQFQILPADLAKIENGIVKPLREGKGILQIEYNHKSTIVPINVEKLGKPAPIDFASEVIAILTRQGCNSGSCHGSPQGKGGFNLSLFGYDPSIDEESLTRDGLNRRTDIIAPESSLILRKPLLEISHVGGKKLDKQDIGYQILRDWIAEGGSGRSENSPSCQKITIGPASSRVIRLPNAQQQLRITATSQNKQEKDVTSICTYDVSDKEIIKISPQGLITGLKRGVAAATVRYLDQLESILITVVEDQTDFVWSEPEAQHPIDQKINQQLKTLGILPSPVCSDEVFIRRIYLDLTGLLPDREIVETFLKDTRPEKRTIIVDQLLASDAYARFWALRTADLFRVNPQKLSKPYAESFSRWIIEAFRTNMPFDRFAKEILTAKGNGIANPPSNYFFTATNRDDLTETTAQLFLGSRINCAKCHNHPYEKWTQNDYYSIQAAFVRLDLKDHQVEVTQNGETMHPGSKKEMKPWGLNDTNKEYKDRRELFSAWLLQKNNPFFAHVEANRIWANLFGRGIVHPVDDFRSSNPPANGPLLDLLAEYFRQSGYNRKALIRYICLSQAYQRSTATNRWNQKEEFEKYFAHGLIRRLSAEQLADGIGQVCYSLKSDKEITLKSQELQDKRQSQLLQLQKNRQKWEESQLHYFNNIDVVTGLWYRTKIVAPLPAKPKNKNAKLDPVKEDQSTSDLFVQKSSANRVQELIPIPLGEQEKIDFSPIMGTGKIYLTQTVTAKNKQKLALTITHRGTVQVWLNRKPVKQRASAKKANPRQITPSIFDLELQNGENDVCVSFTLAQKERNLPINWIAGNAEQKIVRHFPQDRLQILKIPPEKRTATQTLSIRQWQEESDSTMKSIDSQIERLNSRQDYATQRYLPMQNSFMKTFGQPLRESPCACERSNEPTIQQMLQLLNSDTISTKITQAANQYAKEKEFDWVNSLYINALSRHATAKEMAIIQHYVSSKPDRSMAIRDIIWSLLNNREFLFQH